MSGSRYENLNSVMIDEENEVDVEKEILNLVRNYFEPDSLVINGIIINNNKSQDKSFETSSTDLTGDGLKAIQPKFRLSSVLKENVILGARKLKLNLIRNLSQLGHKEILLPNNSKSILNDSRIHIKRYNSSDSQTYRE